MFASPSHTSVGLFAMSVGPWSHAFAQPSGPHPPVFASPRCPVRKPLHIVRQECLTGMQSVVDLSHCTNRVKISVTLVDHSLDRVFLHRLNALPGPHSYGIRLPLRKRHSPRFYRVTTIRY